MVLEKAVQGSRQGIIIKDYNATMNKKLVNRVREDFKLDRSNLDWRNVSKTMSVGSPFIGDSGKERFLLVMISKHDT